MQTSSPRVGDPGHFAREQYGAALARSMLLVASMSILLILVPEGRNFCGRALLIASNGSTRAGPIRVLATASGWAARRHGNASRDWRKPYGHTPAGSYVVAGSLPPGVVPRPKRWKRFGMLGALVLQPVEGDALEAARAGRSHFLLHGGPPDDRGRLRPTFGGVRVADRELGLLLQAVNDANAAQDPVSLVKLVETSEPTWRDEGARDRAGRLRPSPLASPRSTRSSVLGSVGLEQAAFVALAVGIAGRRWMGRRAGALTQPDRRDFLGISLLTLGAVGSSACGPPPDHPPYDPGCTADCAAVGVGGGAAGDPPDGGTGADGSADDDGGGSYGGYDNGSGGTDCCDAPSGDDTGDDSSGGAG